MNVDVLEFNSFKEALELFNSYVRIYDADECEVELKRNSKGIFEVILRSNNQ